MYYYLCLLVVLLYLPFSVDAQFCTGTTGDNIFLEGDFGSGSPNLRSPNPNIAPGYSYTFNVPPLDGQYVLTNNTTGWSGLFPTWLALGDNSDDPNGYMMVVNASNAPGLFYEQTITGLCENTLFEFSADIINLIKIGTPDHIDPDVSFLLDGVEFFSTGNIPKTNSWTTYGFTFATAIGQESLTLSLRNNAPGGNGNDLALDNITFRACGPEIFVAPEEIPITLCEGDLPIQFQATVLGDQYVSPAFQWQQSQNQGLTWSNIVGANGSTFTHPPLTEGTYYYRLLIADGASNLASDKCRINSIARIINVPQKEYPQSQTICEGLTYEVGNSVYDETGIYRDTFISSLGCDSILVTDLKVEADPSFIADLLVNTPCPGLADGSIQVQNVSGGNPPYNYRLDGADFGNEDLFKDLAGGQTYTVIVRDNIGCTIELQALVEETPELMLDLGDDLFIELGESVEITPSYNFTPSDFNWEVNTLVDCTDFEDCDVLNFTPTSSQLVSLELFTGNGCFVSDSLFIQVTTVRNVWLPNAFSPNGDDVNDVFTVFGTVPNIKLVEELKIYDRWGNLLFENKDFPPNELQSGWDGFFDGKLATSGVYIYCATVRFADEETQQYRGDVTVVN